MIRSPRRVANGSCRLGRRAGAGCVREGEVGRMALRHDAPVAQDVGVFALEHLCAGACVATQRDQPSRRWLGRCAACSRAAWPTGAHGGATAERTMHRIDTHAGALAGRAVQWRRRWRGALCGPCRSCHRRCRSKPAHRTDRRAGSPAEQRTRIRTNSSTIFTKLWGWLWEQTRSAAVG